ncbi:MAG TPA: hypothetical protein VGS22_21245 [Thermoanaerobaculia bacterium]|nr:hypothetical protein [Thermoanaerobaculia bacterium]
MKRNPVFRIGVLLLLSVGWSMVPAAGWAAPQIPEAAIPPPAIEWVDEALPAQASIAPGDFAGVFSRVSLAARSTEKELTAASDALDAATTAEEAASLLPESVYQDHPELVTFIETGVLAPPPPPPSTLFTGEQIPATPAAGGTLLPGLPPPYGLYTSNPTNNWGMPNSKNGGCGPEIIRGDGAYFDFRRACRQHDLAYRWTPVPPSQRLQVENRLLHEMLYDCSLRGPVTGALCAIRAGIYFLGTTIGGGFSYGATPTPAYNTEGKPMTWPVPYSFCAQPSHPWVFTNGYGNRVPRAKPIYFTGVVRQHSRVLFQLIDGAGNVALQHMTHAARTNCVIHHEQEAIPAFYLPNGVYEVRALFTPWETEEVTVQILGNLEIFTPTGTTSCNQSSHVWVYSAQNPPHVGATIYPNGVVKGNTAATFTFVPRAGGTTRYHTTHAAQNNCVINYEPEARSTAGWAPGLYDIYAAYNEWETDGVVTKLVGVLDLR